MDEICIRVTPSLWLWTAVSRKTRLFLGFMFGDRTDATLDHLLEEQIHCWWWDVPTCTDGLTAYQRCLSRFSEGQHTICTKESGKTSIVEALNTKCRQCQSGLARHSCGVSRRIITDLSERFWLFVERHNRRCIQRWNRKLQAADGLKC
jgi:IS1 family transposase